jgi:hypothetical protein
MVKRRGPPSQGWRTFLRNHAPDIAAMDLFVAPTIGFDLLYAFIIVRLARRDLVWVNVTPHPTADWIESRRTRDIDACRCGQVGQDHQTTWHHSAMTEIPEFAALLEEIVGSQHHRSFSVDWPFEELTRCSLLNRIAQPQKLIYSLICLHLMLAFKIVHRRGADRCPYRKTKTADCDRESGDTRSR